jgi:uracil-DNA glycosylase
MAWTEAMLEELGLAPLWVRRGIATAGSVAPEPTMEAPDVAVLDRSARLDAAAFNPPSESPPGRETSSRTPAVRETAPPFDDDFIGFADPAEIADPAPAMRGREVDIPHHAPGETPVSELNWTELAERVSQCQRCRLCEKRTQTVFGVGDREADWMLVGEAPGENEDKQGEPFVGQAGKLLDNMLRALDLERGKNVYIANVLKCRPPGNRNPEPDEVARCEPYLQRQVALLKPKLIVALGRFAAQTLLKSEASIASMRSRVHRYEGVPVIVTYHPAYLLRSLQDKSKAWADLCLARETYLAQRDEGAPPDA